MTRTPAETNQIIQEAMGECLHSKLELNIGCDSDNIIQCASCKSRYYFIPNYLEHGKPWGEMLNWAMKQEWWDDFIECMCQRILRKGGDVWFKNIEKNIDELGDWLPISVFESGAEKVIAYLIANPSSLAEHIADYLKKEEDK